MIYKQVFDQAHVIYILEALLNLVKFGGQGFVRIAKASFLKHTLDSAFRERVRAGGCIGRESFVIFDTDLSAADLETQTYLDGLITVLVRCVALSPS